MKRIYQNIKRVYSKPSFYGQAISGILIFICLFILYCNYGDFKKVNPIVKIQLLLLFAISIGIHTLGHFLLEYIYNFNPLEESFNFF
jgi:hypothetical protein